MAGGNVIYSGSLLTDHDIYLFKEGRHYRLYDKLGAHRVIVDGQPGVHFAVWAPNAGQVNLIGDFNAWNRDSHKLKVRDDGSGIWEGFIPGLDRGTCYKYFIRSAHNGYEAEKGDPFAFAWEIPPKTASVVWDLEYEWNDHKWMGDRAFKNELKAPMSMYEMHVGSWRRVSEEGYRSLSYRELAHQLAEHVSQTGFTHVELMPVMEHPFYGSWGYQCLGFFAPSSRYGTPQDLMYMIDVLHQHGIGVILDWVPSHFPMDEHGLIYFDGTHLFEHADPRKGHQPDWDSAVFNYGRYEVRSFLVSSGLFWLHKYHADGLRVDAVASMLYLDYSRKEGEWEPNVYGGKENLEALEFIRSMNRAAYEDSPDIQTIAEESTAWPMVSRPVYLGGLGFGMKWNMGWMHDTLDYFSKDSIHRKYHHNQLTFSIWYAFTENFVLALSHDEVVHGKGSLLGKMPGDAWQKFANLRALYGYMWGHPGKKLLFMGCEFGQGPEWAHDAELQWAQLEDPQHEGVRRWVADLNAFYRAEPAMYELDFSPEGFQWVDFSDADSSTISFLRKDSRGRQVLAAFNFTPVPRPGYRLGVPRPGYWQEVLNSDSETYGGSGWGNLGGVNAEPVPSHGHDHSLPVNIPPLGALFFRPQDQGPLSEEEQIRYIHPSIGESEE